MQNLNCSSPTQNCSYAELPIYKYYQAMQFAALGHRFPWDAHSRKACVPRPRPTPISRRRWIQSSLGPMARSGSSSPCT
jgi:hypothetical protein